MHSLSNNTPKTVERPLHFNGGFADFRLLISDEIIFFIKKPFQRKGKPNFWCLMFRKAVEKHLPVSERLEFGSVRRSRICQLLATVAVMITLQSGCVNAESGKVYSINLPVQSVAFSLTDLSVQIDRQLLFPYRIARDIDANPVNGRYTLEQALKVMLKGTGFSGGLTSKSVLMISLTKSDGAENETEGKNEMNTKKSILATTIGFFMGAGFGPHALGQDDGGEELGWVLEEIVVTATKRATGIQDTPMAISALSSDAIEKRGLVGMDDYLRSLPGVSMQDRGAGQNNVVVRGIASNPQSENSPTGIYFGETPVTGLGSVSAGDESGSVDLKLVDIERVEVLRGPQGTLYGSGSLGGTVRVIPVGPNLSEVEGRVATRYSQTSERGGDNTMVQGVINVPLIEDTLAVRAVAYQFDNSGYIKNIAAEQPDKLDFPGPFNPTDFGGVPSNNDDVGNDEYTGFRLSTLWQATDELTVKLSRIEQDIEQEGRPEVNLNLDDDFQQVRLNSGAKDNFSEERVETDLEITNLVINYAIEWGEITASSSWINYEAINANDISAAVAGLPLFDIISSGADTFIEEIKFVSSFDGPLQTTVGLYYEDQDFNSATNTFWSGDPDQDDVDILAPGASAIFDTFDSVGATDKQTEQKALFAEVSYDISDQITATVGGRYFDYDQTSATTGSGILSAGSQVVEGDDSGESYKFNLTYTPSEDMLIYGQWAEGFRLGQPLVPLRSDCLAPDGTIIGLGFKAQEKVAPDNLDSYELGLKTTLADGRITLNTAVYRINWEGIPVTVFAACGQGTILNAGESKSEGVEIEVQAAVTENLQLDFSASYGESTLTEDAPRLGSKGDNLPGSADVNASIGLEYLFTVSGLDAFARGDYSYIGEYYHNIDETGEASGGFSQVNVKMGVAINAFDIDLFVNNLTNANDFTWIESVFETTGTNRGYQLRPRTVGINVAYKF